MLKRPFARNRSSQLRRLEIVCCYHGSWRWNEALKKFSFLEELNIYRQKIPKEAIETVGLCFPMLRTLRVNQEACRFWPWDSVEKSYTIRNETTIAIGENLPELRHLELIENYMSNIGLQVILDGCCHLEFLDLRQC
ncbi:unnamed protein product [Lactuca saligna]|uniref:Uncharacterized protein n=1 Tax=Lactuca saligna TaxID=75948 RepID=A0AA36A2Q4_LACSI|nr:unnamed protein product [Lactuca saligna]